MNIIIEYTLAGSKDFYLIGQSPVPQVRAFMDDLNLLSNSVSQTSKLLSRCSTALNTGHSTIPSIQLVPVRFLGRVIDGSLSDRNAVDGLQVIAKSFFNSSQKLFILQNLLIARIQWSLLIYEISLSHVIKLERKISTYMRKWLKLHHSILNFCFYSKLSTCPLPFKSLSSILKSSKISGHHLLRDSADHVVATINPKLKCGRWNVEGKVRECEMELNFRKVSGCVPDFGIKRVQVKANSEKGTPLTRFRRCQEKLTRKLTW